MKIAVLHSSNQGFFPRFFTDLCRAVDKAGDDVRAFSPVSGNNLRRTLSRQTLWGHRLNWFIHFNLYRFTGLQDIFSYFSTLDLIRKLKSYDPDIFHLNVINECNICFPLLTRYLNKTGKHVVWTFHDCRTFTGRCAYFDEVQCFRWKTGCGNCPKGGLYSPSYIDNTHLEWKIRKSIFTGIRNLTIITPSEWLAGLVKASYFKNKDIRVIHNGIDTSSFSTPIEVETEILKHIEGKIVLGVAASWEHRKGLDTMIWLANHLPDKYHIVIVGKIPPHLQPSIPGRIVCIPPTDSKEKLIAIYQRASVFVNPTLADNFPTVNIEALGAGLPVVTFNTGGSAECIVPGCGISVRKGDNKAMLAAIIEILSHPMTYTKSNSIERSKDFSLKQYDKYIKLFHCFYEE